MKHPQTALCSLLAVLCLTAAGCMKPSDTTTAVDKSGWPGAPSVSVHTFADNWSDPNSGGCEYSFTFPEFTRPSSWNNEDAPSDPILERANLEILRAYGFASPSGTSVLNPDEVGAEFIDMCKTDLADISKELGPEAIANMNYAEDSSFTVQLLTSHIASISIDTYEYTGGAHGNPGMMGVTLDMATGQKLMLGNVVKNDQLQSIMKRAYAEILRDYEDALYEEARTEINAIVNDTTTMTPEAQVEKFGNQNFFLSGDGLMLFWNVYDITPYVAGQQMVFIPWSDLEGKLLVKRP